MLHAYWRSSFPISVLSLSSIHILQIESLFRFSLKGFGSSPFRAPARASMWSFMGRRLYRFQFFFLCVSILMRRWPGFFEFATGFDLASFRKNVEFSSPRPRCLGEYYYSLSFSVSQLLCDLLCVEVRSHSQGYEILFLLNLRTIFTVSTVWNIAETEGEFLVKKVLRWEGVRREVTVTLQLTSNQTRS